MRSVLLPATALALLAFCSPDDNRRSRETGMVFGDAAAPADSASADAGPATPAAILSQVYLANTSEIQLSKLAAKQASAPAVKRIAAKLVADHTRNREQLRALAQKLGLTLTPAAGGDLSAVDSAAMRADFDQSYIEHAIKGHQDNIEEIRNQLLPAAQNDQVRAYLQKTLTELEGHLAALQEVQRQVPA